MHAPHYCHVDELLGFMKGRLCEELGVAGFIPHGGVPVEVA